MANTDFPYRIRIHRRNSPNGFCRGISSGHVSGDGKRFSHDALKSSRLSFGYHYQRKSGFSEQGGQMNSGLYMLGLAVFFGLWVGLIFFADYQMKKHNKKGMK
ncbi:hypothetical protein [Duodenibacillus massiliensis]|uniref:hypothetical protein n=1 Tax=Duodenibacillus massiliensis TaxID=1852381 RepID=UPI00307D6F16